MSENKSVVAGNEKTEVGALALITLQPAQYAAEVYAPFKQRLSSAIDSLRNVDYDITTTKGLEVATKARRLVADIRIAAEKERKSRKEPITQIGKLLDSSYKDLEASILPLESLFDDDIKAEEKRKEEVRKEKERAEAARIQAIQSRIEQFGKLAMQSAGKGSEAISGLKEQVQEIQITDADFEEFIPQAAKAKEEAMTALQAAYVAAYDAEQAKEAERIAREEETRKQAKERAELAAKQAELDRVAAEQEAERKRLADAQAAEAKRLADAVEAQQAEIARLQQEAAARIKAEADAEEARQKAAQAAHAAEMKRQADELAAQRAAFEAEQAAAKARADAEQKAKDDAARLEADHAEALSMNEEFDLSAEQRRATQELLYAEYTAAGILGIGIAPATPYLLPIAEMAEEISDTEPTDEEIVELYVLNFGGTPEQAIERLLRFDLAVAHG